MAPADGYKNYIGYEGAVTQLVDGKELTRLLHGPDEFNHQHLKKLISLTHLLENLFGIELIFAEYLKAARIIFDQKRPSFELEAKQRDLAKIKQVINDLQRSQAALKKAADILVDLPRPADLHLLSSQQRVRAEQELLGDYEEFYRSALEKETSQSTKRQAYAALAIRAAFERYTNDEITVGKDREGPTTYFAYCVQQVFEHLKLGSGYYEAAIAAKNCDGNDVQFQAIKREMAAADLYETENAAKFCPISLTYVMENEQHPLGLKASHSGYKEADEKRCKSMKTNVFTTTVMKSLISLPPKVSGHSGGTGE